MLGFGRENSNLIDKLNILNKHIELYFSFIYKRSEGQYKFLSYYLTVMFSAGPFSRTV